MTEQPCPFCEIVAGRAPAEIIEEWPEAIAIVPLNPVVQGHVLVLPKRHAADFAADPEVTALTMTRSAELAEDLRTPVKLVTGRGEVAGQEVPHLAVALIPQDQNADKVIPPTPDSLGCPVCLGFRVRRSGRALLTCGSRHCAYELRTRPKRGGPYYGGRPAPSENIRYNSAHARARKQLQGRPCAEADETCSGRLEAALRPDMPTEMLRYADDGTPYYSGLDATLGYRNLCRSHHAREGALVATLSRHPYLRDAFRLEQVRAAHAEECPGACLTCVNFERYDDALREALHLVPRAENDGLALPWYSGRGKRVHT